MNENQLLLIDLSAIAHQIWHISGNEPDPSFVSNQIVVKVRQLASEHPYAAICCDNGKSFRADIDASYKANRDTENRAPLRHQMDIACETLKKDGFPIWSVKGYEADDLIASAVAEAAKIPDTSVLIASSDKDLTQLVNERVSVKSVRTGDVSGPAEVKTKFGVTPAQMGDFLALVGDKSDNIAGARGIGAVNAAKLLTEFGSLKALYAAMEAGDVKPRGVTPAMRTSLMEFKDRWPVVAQLIALKSDVPIPFAEIAVERTAAPMENEMEGFIEEDAIDVLASAEAKERLAVARQLREVEAAEKVRQAKDDIARSPAASAVLADESKPDTGAAPGKPAAPAGSELVPVSSLAPVEFSQQLEPRTIDEAKTLAKHAFASRMFSAYGTPEAVFMTILAGRELGLTAMASLRGFHMVEGKPTLSADLIRALIIKSGQAKYFRPTERTAERATWETQRGDDPPVSLTFTIEEAKQAGVVRPNSGWMKYPADMLTARASAKLARLVYSDIVFNLYDPSEIG